MLQTMLWSFGGALIGVALAMIFRRRRQRRQIEDDKTRRR